MRVDLLREPGGRPGPPGLPLANGRPRGVSPRVSAAESADGENSEESLMDHLWEKAWDGQARMRPPLWPCGWKEEVSGRESGASPDLRHAFERATAVSTPRARMCPRPRAFRVGVAAKRERAETKAAPGV